MPIAVGLVFLLTLPLIPIQSFEDVIIPISFIDKADAPKIDGLWTHGNEWKQASETIQNYDNGAQLVILTMHDGDYIYVLLELPTDETEDSGDLAYVCFDTDHDSGEPDANDYCFLLGMGSGELKTVSGLKDPGIGIDWKPVGNPDDARASSGMSASPYSSSPHATYEFKIPIDFLGPSDEYGFYAVVYDSSFYNRYAVPPKYSQADYIPIPSQWGLLIFPDGTKPEFPDETILDFGDDSSNEDTSRNNRVGFQVAGIASEVVGFITISFAVQNWPGTETRSYVAIGPRDRYYLGIGLIILGLVLQIVGLPLLA